MTKNLSESEVWHAVHLGVRPLVVMNGREGPVYVSDDESSRLQTVACSRCVFIENDPSAAGVSRHTSAHDGVSTPLLYRDGSETLETAMQNALERCDTSTFESGCGACRTARRRVTNETLGTERSNDVFHVNISF